MDLSVIDQLADELVAFLNATDFGETFAARKVYRPVLALKDAGTTIHVTVVPNSTKYLRATRSETSRQTSIDVGVQRRVADEDEVAAMLLLVERMAQSLLGLRSTEIEAVCRAVENDPVYAPDHLEERRLFTSVLTTTWEVGA